MTLLLLLACTEPADAPAQAPVEADPDAVPTRWTVLVYVAGDNDLEELVWADVNEMEEGGSGDGVEVLVQIDRAEGYAEGWGDWTGARRYRIVHDEDPDQVRSLLLEELGEVDSGDPGTLAEFLAWGKARAPAEHTLLSFWNHGDGWSAAPAPPSIASDDESGSSLSVAAGDLREGLAAHVAAEGPLDLVVFDACYMGSWEVAHSLRDQADVMLASEAWVGDEGIHYGALIEALRGDPALDGAGLAEAMARLSVEESDELTFSAVDLARMDDVAEAVDALAAWGLSSEERSAALFDLTEQSRGADPTWRAWYLDLGDLADLAAAEPDAEAAAAGGTVRAALDAATIANHAREPYAFVGGLSIFADPYDPASVAAYGDGAGATWAEATRWDEWLDAWAGTRPSSR